MKKSKKRQTLNAGKVSSAFSSAGFGMTPQTFFIKTFGWPMVQVPRDDFGDYKADKWLGC
ncbi:MAG: hypothetical protein KJ710_00910 [Candidatus Omnitrophica bacterium]|nr:hypothetical protein [Candidatus Omnitrophota bacterium]